VILDTCGGLGYFAAWCLQGQASQVHSYEKNADVIWLRSLNRLVARNGGSLTLTHRRHRRGDRRAPANSFDAILHDPPRFAPPESFTRKPSMTNWRECSSATANYSTTPAHRTN